MEVTRNDQFQQGIRQLYRLLSVLFSSHGGYISCWLISCHLINYTCFSTRWKYISCRVVRRLENGRGRGMADNLIAFQSVRQSANSSCYNNVYFDTLYVQYVGNNQTQVVQQPLLKGGESALVYIKDNDIGCVGPEQEKKIGIRN